MVKRPGRPRREQQFEEFDPGAGGEFEEFDVAAEAEVEAEVVLQSLSGLTESEDELQSLMAARDEIETRYMQPAGAAVAASSAEEPYDPANVVGVGIGEQTVKGHPTGRLAVKVLVKEKKPERHVASEALVPQTLGGVATDVEESGEIYADMFTARRRPAPCGVSIGNCNRIMAGTLGCLVTRSNQLFILSNNHVIALVNTSPLNAGIPQPGRLDGGVCPQDIIARLTQFIPINFAAGAINLVDAAIARTSPGLVDRRILRPGGLLQPIVLPEVAPAFNMSVQKSGRTTQFRRGFIDLINTTVDVNYAPLGGVARFVRQFRVRGVAGIFSDRGDSGSLVTTFPGNQPVGLLFAGNAANNTTFCNPIAAVRAAFGVAIVA
jgi:hypothetical protein